MTKLNLEMTKLKPCPFCGAGGKLIKIASTSLSMSAWVSCQYCGASGPKKTGFGCERKSIAAWNRRKLFSNEQPEIPV